MDVSDAAPAEVLFDSPNVLVAVQADEGATSRLLALVGGATPLWIQDILRPVHGSMLVQRPNTARRTRYGEARMAVIELSEATETSGPIVKEAPVWRSKAFVPAVIVGYLAIAIVAFWPVLPGGSYRLFGNGGDSVLAMWFLAWVPYSLAHGLNPLFSHALFASSGGVNLAQNTEGPFLGLLTAPFAPFLGPVARANLLMVLAMPASATAAFIVLRKWKVWGPAAAIGGLMYGYSPYVVGQSLGHVVLVFLVLPPFIVLTVVSIVRGEGSPTRLGIQLGLLVTAQFLAEAEIMTTVAILTIWALVCVAVRHPTRVADAARRCLRPFGIAVGVSGALLAYPIWMMLAGPQHYTGTAQPIPNPFYNDLINFVVPGPLQRVRLGPHFVNTPPAGAEAGGYIGIPVLLIAIFFVWRSRHSPRMQLVVAVLLAAMILSLGAHLAVDGHETGVPLPFSLFQNLPLLDNILPVRFSMETAACVAALIAFGLDDFSRSHRHWARPIPTWSAFLASLVLIVVVVTQLPDWPNPSQPASTLPISLTRAVPANDPVAITYPIASPLYTEPMLWQAADDFRFLLVGGYAVHPTPTGAPTGMPDQMNPPGLDRFLEGQEAYNPYLPPVPVTPALITTAREVVARNDIRLVIVDRAVRGSTAVIGVFSRAFGPPTAENGSYVLWASSSHPLAD